MDWAGAMTVFVRHFLVDAVQDVVEGFTCVCFTIKVEAILFVCVLKQLHTKVLDTYRGITSFRHIVDLSKKLCNCVTNVVLLTILTGSPWFLK